MKVTRAIKVSPEQFITQQFAIHGAIHTRLNTALFANSTAFAGLLAVQLAQPVAPQVAAPRSRLLPNSLYLAPAHAAAGGGYLVLIKYRLPVIDWTNCLINNSTPGCNGRVKRCGLGSIGVR
ncbi:hypothetical protein J6590_032736 [Homalodisca vitripennis]|nr:hypothetical protein J6590_032736 [Homalodisca vitripennis]